MTPGAANLNSNAKRRSNKNAPSEEYVHDSDEDETFDINDLAQEEEDALDRRSNENGLSDEFVYDSDADQEEPSDIDDVAQEEEDALMEEQHNDSDSETDDGHGSSLSLKCKANDT
ncbi:unnamed protein product [Fusarium graminearum]|nr:unnamed protein product [Fusarium graminearum]